MQASEELRDPIDGSLVSSSHLCHEHRALPKVVFFVFCFFSLSPQGVRCCHHALISLSYHVRCMIVFLFFWSWEVLNGKSISLNRRLIFSRWK
jgi:hypothetical protein